MISRLFGWLRLARREESWRSAQILVLRHQLRVLQRQIDIEEVDGEEVGQDCLGLTVQELRPRRPFAPRRRWDPGGDQDLPHRRRRHENAEASEFTVDPPVTPPRVLPRHSQDQSPDGATRTRAARVLVLGLADPAAPHDVTSPTQYGLRTDEQAQARSPTLGDDVEQEHDQRPVGPRHLRSMAPAPTSSRSSSTPPAGSGSSASPHTRTTRGSPRWPGAS